MYKFNSGGNGGKYPFVLAGLLASFAVSAQETPDEAVEEIIVTGTHIEGMSEESLPLSVLDAEQIKYLGAVNMLDLLTYIPAISDFEFEDTSTDTNGARGDVAGVNLRGIGSGNTLVLINGRRMVTHPTFAAINSVPVTFYNVNSIPSSAVARIEVLRDGASALYGADASAGVVNFVTRVDDEGFQVSGKYGASSDTNYDESEIAARGGWSLNSGRTNLGLFATYYDRSGVHMNELPELNFQLDRVGTTALPEEWRDDSQLRNDSSLTPYARVQTGALNAEEQWVPTATFHVDPATGDLLSGSGSARYNFNEDQIVTPDTDRFNVMGTVTHELGNGMEAFGDATYYTSTSNTYRAASPLDDSLAFLIVPASSFHNPTGEDVLILGWRPVDLGPRVIEVDQDEFRVLGGLRGGWSGWDWESALLYSQAESTDTEGNRQAKSLFTSQLQVNGPDALNPFVGPGGNTQAALDGIRVSATDVRTSRITLWDLRVNRSDLWSLPGGAVGAAAGVEWRREYYEDDRDPRLDGSQPFTNGAIFDESDLIGVSATFDSSADRDTASAYGELFLPLVGEPNAMPLVEALELQLAVRYENTSDFDATTKPKIALRWESFPGFSLRASYTEGFRAPNLPQMNQGTIIRRIDGIEDPLRADVTGRPVDTGDTYRVTTRIANPNLEPEDTETSMYGLVFSPDDGALAGLRITWDYFTIKQEGVVGLLDPEDSLALDVLLREQGSFNPDVERASVTPADQAAFDAWNAANPDDQRTPVGVATNIVNQYMNLDPRELSGWDASIQYTTPDTRAGLFTFGIDATKLTQFDQQFADETVGAVDQDLIKRNGNPEWRATAILNWLYGNVSANLAMRYVGEVYDTSLSDGGNDRSGYYDAAADTTYWLVDDWTVWNLALSYSFAGRSGWANGLTLNAGVRNLTDEAPPFADETFGYFSSLHNSYGRVPWAQLTYAFGSD